MMFYWFWLTVVPFLINFQTVITFESLHLLHLLVQLVTEVDGLGELFLKDVLFLLKYLEPLIEVPLGTDFLTRGLYKLTECLTLCLK